MATQPVSLAQARKAGLSRQQFSTTAGRQFTGDANRVSLKDMEDGANGLGQPGGASSNVFSKAMPAPQFTAGTASAPVSPSKKRLHRHIKLPQTAAPSGSGAAPKINPFAPHGLSDAAAKPPAQGKVSPVKAQQSSPVPSHRHSVKRSSGVQGMNIDTPIQAAKPSTEANKSTSAQADSASMCTSPGFGATVPPSKQQQPAYNISDDHSFSFQHSKKASGQGYAGERTPDSHAALQPEAGSSLSCCVIHTISALLHSLGPMCVVLCY